MSASADQLEEQGTFGTGQALIFYEGLLKPFKMRVCEWERGITQKKYDSPTNMQLYEHLKDNETYNTLLKRSALIMQEKMKSEFDVLRRQAESIKKTINKKYAEITVLSGNLSILEKKLLRLTETEDIAETRKHIADTKRICEKKQAEFDGAVTRDLKKICWSFANLYFAYMTLSKNYSINSNDMFMCTINNYLSLFGILKSLHDVTGLKEAVLKETSSVIKDIKRYVDISFAETDAILVNHPGYSNAIYESGNYLINLFDAKADSLAQALTNLINLGADNEQGFEEFGKDFSASYFKLLNIAEKYYAEVDGLSALIHDAWENEFRQGTPEWDDANLRSVEYEGRKKALYKALAACVVKIFKCASGITGINRRALLIQTTKLLISFRSIVDYRNRSATTILSEWSRYPEIWVGTNEILIMEMSAKFTYLHQLRLEAQSNACTGKLSEETLTDLCEKYNTIFQIYSKVDVGSVEYECILVNHYVKYLQSMLKLGAYTHTAIAETSNGNWRICSKFIKRLIQDEYVKADIRADWNQLSVIMKSICDSSDG